MQNLLHVKLDRFGRALELLYIRNVVLEVCHVLLYG